MKGKKIKYTSLLHIPRVCAFFLLFTEETINKRLHVTVSVLILHLSLEANLQEAFTLYQLTSHRMYVGMYVCIYVFYIIYVFLYYYYYYYLYIYIHIYVSGPILAAYCVRLSHAICNHLPFFKIFSNFVHFCPNFPIFNILPFF